MKNYWLDKKYPLATAVRDWRKGADQEAYELLEEIFHQMALKLASSLLGSRRGKFVDRMEDEAWDHVEKFDLRKKAEAVTYFTNVMKSVIPETPAKTPARSVASTQVSLRTQNLRRQAIQRSLWKKKGTP